MKREDILAKAIEYTTKDRNATHGEPENNFNAIADMWSLYLGVPIGNIEVAVMMTLFKIARIKANPEHVDSWIDAAGYLACGGEIATKRTSPKCWRRTSRLWNFGTNCCAWR